MTTSEGFDVYHRAGHGGVASVVVGLPSGAAADPEGREGLAYVRARLWRRAFGTRSRVLVERAWASLGATLDVEVREDGTVLRVDVLDEAMDQVLPLLYETLRPTNEVLPHTLVELLDDLDQEALAQRDDDSSLALRRLWLAMLGPDHPYSHPLIGTRGSRRAIQVEDVIAFRKRHDHTKGMVLAIASSRTPAEIRRLAQQWSGMWSVQGVAGRSFLEVKGLGAVQDGLQIMLMDKPLRTQHALAWGLAWPRLEPAAEVALALAIDILAGDEGRLNGTLRTQHAWLYGVTFRIARRRAGTVVTIRGQCRPDRAIDVLRVFLEMFEQWRQGGVRKDELQRVLKRRRRRIEAVIGSPGDHVSAAAWRHLRRQPVDVADERALLDDVTPAMVNKALREHLRTALTLVMVCTAKFFVHRLSTWSAVRDVRVVRFDED